MKMLGMRLGIILMVKQLFLKYNILYNVQTCPPAFLFLLFGMVHIILAIFNLNYMIGLKYFLLTLLFTTILNYICEKQLSFIFGY